MRRLCLGLLALAACQRRDAPVAPPPPDAAAVTALAPVAPAALDPLDALLRDLARAPAAERPGLLFELASALTTQERGAATPARLEALLKELRASIVQEDGAAERATALAALAALAATLPEVPPRLREGGLGARLLALYQEEGDAQVRGRALLILGAMQPGSPAAAKAATRGALREALASEDRLLHRLAALATSLARDEALDPALLAALLRDAGVDRLEALPPVLPREVAVELLPLLPVYVDLLLSMDPPQYLRAALRLTQAAVAAEPRAGSARFFRAQVLSRAGQKAEALQEAQQALALGNLPGGLAAALGQPGRAQIAPLSVAAARARVRELLKHRPPLAADPHRLVSLDAARVEAVDPAELERRSAQVTPGSAEALRLGAELLRRYPFRSEAYYDSCLRSFLETGGDNHDLLPALGLSVDRDRTVVGVVRVDGARYGVTCALCHGQVGEDGARRDGLPSRIYDQGLLLASCLDQALHHKSGNRNVDQLMAFGPGRNDSTSDAVHDPTDIPSLLGLRVGAAVRWNADTPALEVQIDRNLSLHAAPRPVLRVLADYLRALPLPPAPEVERDATWQRGEALFQAECERCHSGPARTSGRVVPVEVVGTDRARVSAVLPNSTAGYKVPSLLRIGLSAPYLHDGSVPSLEALLAPKDPRRGHRFGAALQPADRRALLAFLRSL